MKSKNVLFHASSVGKLMIDGQGSTITEKQLERIKELEDKRDNPEPLMTTKQFEKMKELRQEKASKEKEGKELATGKKSLLESLTAKEGKFKELTEKEKEELQRLIEKRDKPFELGASAKSYIEEVWNKLEMNYSKPVITDPVLKGHLNEEKSISLVQNNIPSKDFRFKNTTHFADDYFIGTPDIILNKDQIVEDVKTSESLQTFQKAEFPRLYYAQLQVYMHLLGFKKARLIYCLTNTPASMIAALKKKVYYSLKFSEEHDSQEDHNIKTMLYEEACEKINQNHDFSQIPEENKLKVFELEYNESYIEELKFRIDLARQYYDEIKMPNVNDVIRISEC